MICDKLDVFCGVFFGADLLFPPAMKSLLQIIVSLSSPLARRTVTRLSKEWIRKDSPFSNVRIGPLLSYFAINYSIYMFLFISDKTHGKWISIS